MNDQEHGNGAVEQEAGSAPAVGPAVSPAEEAALLIEALTGELERLKAANLELDALVKRRQADYDNFRKRSERERAESTEFASMEATRALLPVLDNFERALKGMPEQEGALREYARGMELIYQQLLGALARLGLEPLAAMGQRFDPNIHEALRMVDSADADDQTVVEEYERGYNFRGRLLRAAKVAVAVKPQLG